jgi:4-hydroxy-3-polyprenylbenzoate decarboxylase
VAAHEKLYVTVDPHPDMSLPVVVGITGATGQIYGLRALELLAETDHETHLILSKAAEITIKQETDYEVSQVRSLAEEVHNVANIGASTASGSFSTAGMLVAPCSMKTLANIATGNSGNLITRTADVMLKERRSLVLMPREKPFNRIHLENMLSVTDAGGLIFPPFPSFYQRPESVDEIVDRTVMRALSHVTGEGFEVDEWRGLGDA